MKRVTFPTYCIKKPLPQSTRPPKMTSLKPTGPRTTEKSGAKDKPY